MNPIQTVSVTPQVTGAPPATPPAGAPTHGGNPATADFKALLSQRLVGRDLSFSTHAQTRLKSRGIDLSNSDLDKIEQATNTAKSKGSKDSLILMNDLGLIVNIKNRTVLTAIDAGNMKENIFTNIDSTVIVPKT